MTRRDRIVLGVLAVVVVLAGFWMLVAKPVTTELGELDRQRADAVRQRDAALAGLASAEHARAQYRRDQTTLAVLGKAVPSGDGVPSLLYQLHRTARRAGIDFESVTVGGGSAQGGAGASTGAGAQDATPGTTSGPEGLQVLPLTITFSGSFFKLDRFLRRVHAFARFEDERLDVRGRLLTVDGITLTPPAEGETDLTAQLTASAYVAPKGVAAGGAVGTASGATAGTPSGATAGTASGAASGTPAGTGAAGQSAPAAPAAPGAATSTATGAAQ